MTFLFRNVTITVVFAALSFGLWKLYEHVLATPTIEDQILALSMKPISYSSRNRLSKYYERVDKKFTSLKKDLPYLNWSKGKSAKSSIVLKNWCNSTLSSNFYSNSSDSSTKFNLASKYCVMNVKDQILEESGVKIFNSLKKYKYLFKKKRHIFLPNLYKNEGYEDEYIKDDEWAGILKGWCNDSFKKTYSLKNYLVFNHAREICVERIFPGFKK